MVNLNLFFLVGSSFVPARRFAIFSFKIFGQKRKRRRCSPAFKSFDSRANWQQIVHKSNQFYVIIPLFRAEVPAKPAEICFTTTKDPISRQQDSRKILTKVG